ncbi:sarcosine oxidase subunit beta [Burkholderia sp. YR290]|nr:sarcosine oxidase subunit beta [Burkholderia sp. YR290]
MDTADVVVIGAGIIGLSTGYWLAKSGAKVIVVDKGRVAWEASGRATGFLSLRGETPIEAPLAAEAENYWNSLDDELGYITEWRPEGRLWVANSPEEWEELQETYKTFCTTPFPFRLVDGDKARSIVPCLSETVIGGIHTTRSGHANPQRSSQAFAWAFKDRGGVIREYNPVTDITTEGGKITGVQTAEGYISAPVVINCAGVGVGHIARMVGADVPVAAVRLEAMVTAPLPPLFGVAMVGNGLSLRQTRRGNIHFNGGPHEWIDVDLTSEPAKPNTAIVRNVARRLAELLPSISNVPLLRCWAGIVDVTPDQATLIDRINTVDGMYFATASGHGFGMAPVMGRALADLALTGKSDLPISQLGLSRFADVPADWRVKRQWQAGAYNT